MTTTPKPRADWEAIERDYRTGKLSDQELADKHKNVVTRQAISKRAKTKGWTKDLTIVVRQATKAKVIADQVAERVAKKVASAVAGNFAESCEKTADVVEAIAEISAAIERRHQKNWEAVGDTALAMLTELQQVAYTPEEQNLLAEILAGDGAEPHQVDSARRAIAKALKLSERIASVKALAETFTKVQVGQRLAHGLDDKDGEDPDGELPSDLTPNDIARRIAFALAQGMKQKEPGHG